MKHRTVPMVTKPGRPESHGAAWGMLVVALVGVIGIIAAVVFINHTTLP